MDAPRWPAGGGAGRALVGYADARDGEPKMDDVCGFLGCELLRRVLGAASVPDLSEIADGKARERAELLVGEIGGGVLVDAPEAAELLVEFAEGCYDALALDKY